MRKEAKVADFVLQYVVLLFSLTVHESAHAYFADRLGDPTARRLGRISLNPLVHIDIIGTVILPILAAISGWALIGWAKPVPVNPYNLRNPRRDNMIISGFGPLSNIALAVIFALVFRVLILILPAGGVFVPLFRLLQFGVLINLILAFFNLIPIPPLDGGGVLAGLLPEHTAEAFERMGIYGIVIIYILLFIGFFSRVIFPISFGFYHLLIGF